MLRSRVLWLPLSQGDGRATGTGSGTSLAVEAAVIATLSHYNFLMIKHSENIYVSEFHTHGVTSTGMTVTCVSWIVVVGAVAVSSQAERTRSVVDDHMTGPAGAGTNAIVRTSTATHTVDITRLTPAR